MYSVIIFSKPKQGRAYEKYASCGVAQSDLDASSFEQILELARSLNVRVILDLHQVQGCQNGFDNGGHAGTIGFYNPENVILGVKAWENMMEYLDRKNLLDLIWGFEVRDFFITSAYFHSSRAVLIID